MILSLHHAAATWPGQADRQLQHGQCKCPPTGGRAPPYIQLRGQGRRACRGDLSGFASGMAFWVHKSGHPPRATHPASAEAWTDEGAEGSTTVVGTLGGPAQSWSVWCAGQADCLAPHPLAHISSRHRYALQGHQHLPAPPAPI